MARKKSKSTAEKVTASVKKTANRVGTSVARGASAAKAKASAAYGSLKTKWDKRKGDEEE